jgi:HEAT repeat protein
MALARIGDPDSFAALEQTALDGDDELSALAAETLADARHPDASARLLDAFRRAHGDNRIWRIKSAMEGMYLPSEAPILLEVLKTDPVPMRRRCAAALYGGIGGEPAGHRLETMLAVEPDPQARSGMVEGIARSHGPWVVDRLLAVVGADPSPEVRDIAIAGLASQAEDSRIIPALIHLVQADPDRDRRASSADQLGLLLEKGPPGARDLPGPGQPELLGNLAAQHDNMINALQSALATEPDAKVQKELLCALRLQLNDHRGLFPVMIGIMLDVNRAREVRDEACSQLLVYKASDTQVRTAIRQYELEAKTPPPPPPTPTPTGLKSARTSDF